MNRTERGDCSDEALKKYDDLWWWDIKGGEEKRLRKGTGHGRPKGAKNEFTKKGDSCVTYREEKD